MFAIVGLGNPGSRYERTRHNVGVWVIQRLVTLPGVEIGRWQQQFNCSFAKATVDGAQGFFVLPQSYMNLSGEAAAPLLNYYNIAPKDVVVVYDELDLDPGVLRLKQGGSSGGHRGVEDMLRHLGSGEFVRVRVGIGHPRRQAEPLARMDVSQWVLAPPSPADRELIERSVGDAAEAIRLYLREGLPAAQAQYHGPRDKG